MIREAHLSVYDLTLTTCAPLFVGSGSVLKKTDYLLDHVHSKVTVLDTNRLLAFLVKQGLADAYEAFILSGQTNMYTFLRKQCGLSQTVLNSLSLYQVDIAGTLDDSHSLKEILRLSRTADNRAYVPGSTLKGALRTAMLLGPVSAAEPGEQEHLHRRYTFRESQFVNTLQFQNARTPSAFHHGASVLQGIRISDSLPVDNSRIVLSSKADVLPDGRVNHLNVLWECIAPGTQLHFKLTLDHSVLDSCIFDGKQGICLETIRQAIGNFAAYCQKNYESKFPRPEGARIQTCNLPMWLGGNTGYFTKTLAYPYWDDRGLEEVAAYMQNTFPRHKHKQDLALGIAPHTMSYACCRGILYPMGLCEVEIT